MAETDFKVEILISKVGFLTSAAKPSQFPQRDRPEIVFAGRSNVGKSSLLNRLLARRNIARTSTTPGRTQTINFFDVGGRLYFVDLPGYGFARVPLTVKQGWRPMVEGYLTAGRDIRLIVLLIDVRRDPREEELNLLDWFRKYQLPFLVVVTKADKVSRSQGLARSRVIQQALGLIEAATLFSATTGVGREAIWDRILMNCRPPSAD